MIPILLSILFSFFITFLFTPKLIIFLKKIKLTGLDVHKKEKPNIAEMGGPAILVGFLSGVFLFIWIKIFLYGTLLNLVEIFAGITTILIITLIGIFDDLSGLIKIFKNDYYGNKRIGLKQWQKPLLTLGAAIPLMAIMAGDSSIVLPIIGNTDIGIIYPLILIPIGIVGASNAINMLAGFNGLEAGLGIIILSALGVYSYLFNEFGASIIAFTLVAALLAFLRYNWYPAKIMPGDSLSYMIGASIAVVAIIGNIEKFALLCFIPWFLEFILKIRSGFKAENFGILQEDGTLKAPYKKTYSLTHFVMKRGKFTEKQIVLILIGIEIIFVALAFLSFIFRIF